MAPKQTALEWLIEKLTDKPIDDISDEYWFGIVGEAKLMEKEQLISFAYTQIQHIEHKNGELIFKKVPEEIYNETYNQP